MRVFRSLYVQVIVAIVLGVIVGSAWPSAGVGLKSLGDGFVSLIKMVIAPIVFCTVTAGIAHMGDMRRAGRVGLKALVYFEIVSSIALLVGFAVAMIVHPGQGFTDGGAALTDPTVGEAAKKAADLSISGYLLDIIPASLFSPFATGNLLQVVFVAVLTGIALVQMGEVGKSICHKLDQISAVFFTIIRMIVRLAPIGAFGAMAFTIGKFGLGSLVRLGSLVATFYLTSILFVLIILGTIAYFCGFSIFRFLAYIKDELLIVLGTSSSESVLPQLMNKMELAGVSKSVVGVVIPTGYSFNLDGTNIYMTLATLFLVQATGTSLTFVQIATLLLVAMLTSKGASGVTGAGFITLAATIEAVHTIPIASLALIVGVDRFMSECRALTNTVGNGVASIVVARWDGELDRDKLALALAKPEVIAAIA